MGGHPRRQGHPLLREHLSFTRPGVAPLANPAAFWADLAQHLERLWGNYMNAVTRHSPTNVYPDRFQAIDSIFAAWRGADQAPNKI